MASPLTGATLTAQRANNRWKEYRLAISHPNTIFTALINQSFTSLDNVIQIIYDNGTGTYSNVKPGMSCWISATGYGAFDIGIVRVRKALTSTIAYIGKVSGIQLANNYYLTFVDDFNIWAREPLSTDTSTLIDQDVEFNNINSFAPIVRAGPAAIVLELTGATVAHTRPAPTIYSPVGNTAGTYAWTAPTASATANMDTSTPTITYNTPGEHYESCVMTDNQAASTTIYRKVFINPPSANFSIGNISGDIDSGDWSAEIEGYSGTYTDYKTYCVTRSRATNVATMNCQHPHGLTNGDVVNIFDMTDSTFNATGAIVTVTDSDSFTYPNSGSNAGSTADVAGFFVKVDSANRVSIANLHERALCVLWKRDFVGTAADTACGYYAEGKNVRLVGWIDNESVEIDPQYGAFSFTIHGPAFWEGKIAGAPMIITDVSTTPTTWNQMQTMNTDKALYRLIRWQSTLASITDVNLTGSTTRISTANVNSGYLREQIDGLAGEKLLARMACDRFGGVWIYIPQSLQDSTGKAALTVLWDATTADWVEKINIDRETTQEASQIEIGGTTWDGTTEVQVYSHAPGSTNAHYGSPQAPYTTLAVDSQTVINRLAGDVLAESNSEFPSIDMVLGWANDFLDIAPPYIVATSIAAADTPRGITWTTKRLIPQSISYEFDNETGAEGTVITLCEETTGIAGIDYFPPQPPDTETVIIPPFTFPPIVPPVTTWFPPVVFQPPVCGGLEPANNFALAFSPSSLIGTGSVLSSYCYYPCKLRRSTAPYPTYLTVPINYYGDSIAYVTAYAIDSGKNRVATLTVTANAFSASILTYTGVSDLDVAGFEIALAAGAGADAVVGPLSVLSSGYCLAVDGSVAITGLSTSTAYAVDGKTGPWTGYGGTLTAYQFGLGLTGWTGAQDGRCGWTTEMGGGMQLNWTQTKPAAAGVTGASALDLLYARVFVTPTATSILFNVSFSGYNVRGGGMGYNLLSTSMTGVRSISIGPSRVYNVCAIG
jgi:hypothetical protein